MKKLFLSVVCCALVSGCSIPLKNDSIKQVTLADAQTASAMAKAANDTAGQKCYDYLISQLESSVSTGTFGLLSLNEAKRTVLTQTTNLGQSCGGVLPLTIAP